MKQEFLKPKLEGDRFREHTVPLEVISDFAALQEMLLEVAKWEFKKNHPERERIPRNFTQIFDLHLETTIGEGSAVLTIAVVFTSLFPPSNLHYFEQARTDIVNAIAAAEAGSTPDLPSRFLNYFDRFGRSLRTGESISFSYGNQRATLTPEIRKRLIQYAAVEEWTEEVALRVRIPAPDKGKNTFQMELSDGSRLESALTDTNRDTILQAFDNYKKGRDEYVLIQGIARKDRQDHFKGFESIEHVTSLDRLDVHLRLEEISKLEEGWLDGKGLALPKDKLFYLAKLFDQYFEADQLPFLYPTPDGHVQAEWSINELAITLEIDLSSFFGMYQSLNLRNHTCTDTELALAEPEGWIQINEALKQAGTATGSYE